MAKIEKFAQSASIYNNAWVLHESYTISGFFSHNAISSFCRIRSNYRTYPCQRTVKQFRNLQITASVLFVYFFIKACVGRYSFELHRFSMQFKWVSTTYTFLKKLRNTHTHTYAHTHAHAHTQTHTQTSHKHHSFADRVLKRTFSRWMHILLQVFPTILKNLSAQCVNYVKYGD